MDPSRSVSYVARWTPRGRRATRRLATLAAALALAVTLAALGPAWAQGGDLPPFGVAEGMTGPDFTMTTLDGEAFRLREARGAPVLLNFWASWCPPCVDELPLLDAAARALDGRAQVVLLNVGEPHRTVAPFLADLGVTAPVVLRDARDADGPPPDGAVPSRSVALVYQAFGLPTTVLLDARGVIVARVAGPLDDASLGAVLARAGLDW